ncbi:MAG: hypothetical protein QM809_16830 [Gordonia sp. (in: high G+C Gram-positive bacteria)]
MRSVTKTEPCGSSARSAAASDHASSGVRLRRTTLRASTTLARSEAGSARVATASATLRRWVAIGGSSRSTDVAGIDDVDSGSHGPSSTSNRSGAISAAVPRRSKGTAPTTASTRPSRSARAAAWTSWKVWVRPCPTAR